MFFKIKKKQLAWSKTIKSVPHNYSIYTFDIEPKGFLAVFVRPSGIIPILIEWILFKNDREVRPSGIIPILIEWILFKNDREFNDLSSPAA
ncbi:MAG: hypothetical protein JRF62_07930 [Deltaproteobacteria bacterium]|nr:hypothetical protein [Deltaproteobacteria bacterium]